MDLNKLIEKFEEIYGSGGEGIRAFQAPGRINLIGEHIDYNGGHVFPMALDMNNTIIARPNNSSFINMAVTSLPNRVSADIEKLESYKNLEWGNYQAGVAYMLKEAGYNIVGCDLLYHGEVPYGAGLSSSASIEVATAVCLASLGGAASLDMKEIAVLSQRAENEYVGMNCGIMDQFISALGEKDHALYLDCANLEYEKVPLELGEYTIVITNTNAAHKLTDSQYNTRRAECERALSIINENGGSYEYLCDIRIDELEKYEKYFNGDLSYKRARHCVTEETRVKAAVNVLKSGDLQSFGKLLNEANISMRDDYEATGQELDTVFDIALGIDGVVGSRMTGGGFGGCNISIVAKDKVEGFMKTMKEKYTKIIGYEPSFYFSDAGAGAGEIMIKEAKSN
ncbi:MAG: galactokinase [Clostridia bacterium]|nr:galactokinase [Clostridia bacterium]